VKQEQLKNFRAWFDDYVAGFYGDDEFVNANMKMKEEHTIRTCKEMMYLAEQLNLSDNQKKIADVIALFHDIGRFEQFVKYRTYNDIRSMDHCLLGLEVLRRKKVLDGVEQKEKELIGKAIEYHGRKELPADLDGDCLLFSKLIRDADKIDALYTVTQYYREYRDNPQGFKIELELPDEPRYSKAVAKGIMDGRRIDYNELQTLNDMKLCNLGWAYDVNFTATLKRIKQRKFFQMLIDLLPHTSEIKQIEEKVFAYVNSRMENKGFKKEKSKSRKKST
jgi:putative nucleotidyltransferase with HDIG domain